MIETANNFYEPTLNEVKSKVKICKKQGDWYIAFCPAHNDERPGGNPSLRIKENIDGTVTLKCFSQQCEKKDIKAALGFPIFKDQINQQRKKEKFTLENFANKKNLPIEFLETKGIYDNADGLVFTYLNQDGQPARSKIRHGKTAQESFWQRNKLSIVPYNLHCLQFARQNNKTLHIVEGESDTLTLLYHQIIALGIPGASMIGKLEASYLEGIDTLFLHQEPDNAGEGFIKNLLKRLKLFNYSGNVYVIRFPGNGIKDANDLHKYCFDNNLSFEDELKKLISQVVPNELETETNVETKSGTNETKAENRPNLLVNNSGSLITPNIWVEASDREPHNYGKVLSVDPSTQTAEVFFKNPKTGKSAHRTLSVQFLTPINENNVPLQYLDKAKPFKLMTAKELLNQPQPQWLVEQIFLEKSVVFLYGQPGVGKSFVALDLSLSIACGMKWNNKVVQTGSVVYVAAEGSSGISKRLKAWLEHYKKEDPPENLYFITVPANLMHEAITESLVTSIKEVCPNPKMIVLDTFARSLVGGDENSAKDTGLFIAGVDRLKEETGSTVLILHHTQKSNGNIERGSSNIRGSADTMIIVQAETEHGKKAFSLKCDKQKDAEPFDSLQFHLLPVLDSCVPVQTAFETKLVKTNDNILLLLKTLNTFVSTEGATCKQWQESAKNKGMSKSSYHRTLKALTDEVEEGQPQYVKHVNKRYFLTDEGRNFLGLEKVSSTSFISPISPKLVPGTNETNLDEGSNFSPTSSKSISKILLELDGTETETKKETQDIEIANGINQKGLPIVNSDIHQDNFASNGLEQASQRWINNFNQLKEIISSTDLCSKLRFTNQPLYFRCNDLIKSFNSLRKTGKEPNKELIADLEAAKEEINKLGL